MSYDGRHRNSQSSGDLLSRRAILLGGGVLTTGAAIGVTASLDPSHPCRPAGHRAFRRGRQGPSTREPRGSRSRTAHPHDRHLGRPHAGEEGDRPVACPAVHRDPSHLDRQRRRHLDGMGPTPRKSDPERAHGRQGMARHRPALHRQPRRPHSRRTRRQPRGRPRRRHGRGDARPASQPLLGRDRMRGHLQHRHAAPSAAGVPCKVAPGCASNTNWTRRRPSSRTASSAKPTAAATSSPHHSPVSATRLPRRSRSCRPEAVVQHCRSGLSAGAQSTADGNASAQMR
jgi:hypothetical protein